jgi:predicted transcriptional regulator
MPTSIPISSLIRTNTTMRELFVYLYELSPLEVDLLFILIKNKSSDKLLTLEELAELSHRNKTSVFRGMQKLQSLRLCNRIMETRKKEGGYYYLYSAITLEELKTETENRVKNLVNNISRLLKAFEAHVEKTIVTFYEEK